MKLTRIMLAPILLLSIVYGAEPLRIDRNKSYNNINNNQPQQTTSYSNNTKIIINDKPIKDNSSQLVPQLMVNGQPVDKIENVRKKMNEYERALKKPLNSITMVNKAYNYQPGQVINLHIRAGYSCIIDFKDSSKNSITFDYISPGSAFFQITKMGNKLEIRAKDHYRNSNLIVGIKGYDYPVIFSVSEVSDSDMYDSFITVRMNNDFNMKVNNSESTKIKSLILKEVFRYDQLRTIPTIDYEVYSLNDNQYILFETDLLKIYPINKFNKTYYIVLLDKNFIIYGHQIPFSQYSDRYNVYFLNFNDNVFTIRTNPNLGVKKEDIEKYRIIIKG